MRTALITGTSTGIGYATACHLAHKKYRVFASMRNPDTGSAALQEAAEKGGWNLEIVQLDVDDPVSAERAVHQVLQKAGRIDVLINNAGIAAPGPIETLSDAAWKAVFETNFFGAMRLIRLVVPGMRERRDGTVVNISSVAGRLASDLAGAYAASKFALEAASEALAIEVRRFNIRVAIVEPGVILTPIFEKHMREPDPASPYVELAHRKRRVFESRLEAAGQPEDVAKMVGHAIETDEPRLRYPVGWDAEKWIAGRQRMTDEEWLELGEEMTEGAFERSYWERFGMRI